MNLYVFDTDVVSLLQIGHAGIEARAARVPASDLFATVITIDEVLTGWYTAVRKATDPDELEEVYGRLVTAVRFLSRFQVLNYQRGAIDRFDRLRKSKLNVRANDLRIAAIALEVGATVVTRNLRDFLRVPGLAVEDWTLDTPPPLAGPAQPT